MGRIILESDSNYESYMNSARSLVSPRITEFDITNEQIDSIGYMLSVENELISKIPTAIDQSHPNRSEIVEYVLTRTAKKLLIKFGRSERETAYDESVQIGYDAFKSTLEELDSVIERLEKTLEIADTDADTSLTVRPKALTTKSTLVG